MVVCAVGAGGAGAAPRGGSKTACLAGAGAFGTVEIIAAAGDEHAGAVAGVVTGGADIAVRAGVDVASVREEAGGASIARWAKLIVGVAGDG